MFKNLEINIPFFEALEQIPMYQKFIKDIISKIRTLGDELVAFTEKCTAVSQGRKIPIKKNIGPVPIPCIIEYMTFKKVLIDSRASVSLILFFIYQNLGIGKVSDTKMSLKSD